ncbi:MAG: hypothetical protein FWB75_06350 [Oscillospiraceae bacterium]|nr:hypothetical protein [Oscillospiraceae bacterium]
MRNFQQQLEKDIDDVFLNASAMEFVTPHLIGGLKGHPPKSVNVIVDGERYLQRKLRDKVENITLNGIVFFVKKAEWLEAFGNIPKVESSLVFDAQRYLVESVTDDMGVLEFCIEGNRGK